MEPRLPGRYQLAPEPLLGEGGMGRVLLARDRVLDQKVALKIVRPDLAADERFRRQLALEVRVSARFAHPRIVPLHDHGETEDGTPFLGLAYADAGSFASLRAGGFEWPELLRLLLQVADALAHLHARDVVHRDLKPENVLLHTGPDGRPDVWLADFGLASAATALARKSGRTEGTPGYMAPEQALGQLREIGPWTDLYAAGVVIWELVTGQRPFADGQGPMSSRLPAFDPRIAVPTRLGALLANLLSPEPMARYDLAADLRAELLALGPPERAPGKASPALPIGTVARSAPPPGGAAPDEDDDADETLVGLLDERGGSGRSVPPWNRPLPSPLPDAPPVEAGHAATARASLRLFAVRELPMVARDAERAALWAHARSVATDRRGRVVIVVGEAGSGRTRLMRALTDPLQEGGWAESVVVSYARDPGEGHGYAGAARALLRPWNETRGSLEARVRRRLSRERGRVDAAVREEAASLARWCGLLEPGEDPAPIGLGLRELYRHLESRTWRGLSCLVLDDVQWAREEGDGLGIAEALLQRWSDGVSEPVLVVASVRTEDLAMDPALKDRVDALLARGAHRLDLPRLDRAGTEALVAESLQLAPDLAERVIERCEGNPLFARQLLAEWAERGWLVDAGGLRFTLRTGVDADAVLPRDAEALLQGRIQALADASGHPHRMRDLLHLSALAGTAAPAELLEDFAGAALWPFARASGPWVERAGLLEIDSALLYRTALAEAERRPDVRYLHRRLGRAWARRGDTPGTAFEAGRHAVLAGDLVFGVPRLLAAAEDAQARGLTARLDEATRLAWRAVEEERALLSQWAGAAALWRGRAHDAIGANDHARRCYEQAKAAFEASADEEGLVEALVGLGWVALRKGELETAEVLLSDAVGRARQAQRLRIEARAIAGKAWVEQQKRNFSGADILFARVLNRCTQLSDVRGAAEALLGQAYLARRTGRFEEASELYDEATDAFREAGDPMGGIRARTGQATVARQRGDHDTAETLMREAIAAAEELGATHLRMDARRGLAELLRLTGQAARARRVYEDYAAWAARSGEFEGAVLCALGRAKLEMDEGDLVRAYEHLRAAAERLDSVPGHWLWAIYRLVGAELLARRKEHTQTWQWLWSAQELGLGEIVDDDVAACLVAITDTAIGERWANVLRVSGKLAVAQLQGLSRGLEAEALQGRIDAALA